MDDLIYKFLKKWKFRQHNFANSLVLLSYFGYKNTLRDFIYQIGIDPSYSHIKSMINSTNKLQEEIQSKKDKIEEFE